MTIQITGEPSVINYILSNNLVQNARPHNRGSFSWIEVDELSGEDLNLVTMNNGKVHDPHARF